MVGVQRFFNAWPFHSDLACHDGKIDNLLVSRVERGKNAIIKIKMAIEHVLSVKMVNI
jgi:hypothetical protein